MHMSEAKYLALEANSEFKHEYRDGRVYAMTGGSVRHGVITANISTQFNVQLAQRDCTVTSPDVRVHIASKGTYRYPDVTVFCGDPAYVEDRTDTITNPVVLVEVVSPSSALRDYNEKLEEYIQIETLQAYILVSQDQPKVERFTRHEDGEWLYSVVTAMDDEIALPGIDCTLALSAVYNKVRWDDESAAE